LEEDVRKYLGRFDAGWDTLRAERLERLIESGIISENWPLTDRDARVPEWESVADKEWEAIRVAVYAARLARMDQGLGRTAAELKSQGLYDDARVMCRSENGGCAEGMPLETAREFVPTYVTFDSPTRDGRDVRPGNDPSIVPGGEDTYTTYGRAWANVSNAPFREYKHWIHEGGIATPFIASWPRVLPVDVKREQPHQLVDVMATLLDIAGAEYPSSYPGRTPLPLEGVSMVPTLRDGTSDDQRLLYWEHEGNCGVRRGTWKLVRKHAQDWELYDMVRDRTELHELAAEHPGVVAELSAAYEAWAARCGVIPREKVLELYAARGGGLPSE